MARRSENVQLLDAEGKCLRWIERAQAAKMTRTGEATYACRNCSTVDSTDKLCQGRPRAHSMAYTAAPMFRETTISPCSITFREMLANAGVIGSQGFQSAARTKVEYYDPTAMRRELLVTV